MTQKFIIRPATQDDFPELTTLYDQGDAIHRQHLPSLFQKPDGPPREEDFLLALLDDPEAALLVAEESGQLVGLVQVFVRATPELPILMPRRYATVDNIVVKESHRRLGIGQALMEAAHDWAQAHGAAEIELNVYEFNRQAITLYEKLGYQTLSRKMRKSLG
jgi:ribosomal protein S18 acetylase RimI-like enzyme